MDRANECETWECNERLSIGEEWLNELGNVWECWEDGCARMSVG